MSNNIVNAANAKTSRRGFVAGAAVTAGSVLAATQVAVADETPQEPDLSCDVLVLGGGIAGCYAAHFAQEGGASVILVEAASKLGGTALLSGGFVHTWDIDPDNVGDKLASGDPALCKLFMDKWQVVRDWTINDSGIADVSPLDLDYPLYGSHLIGFTIGGVDKSAGRQLFCENMADGAQILYNTYFVSLVQQADGSVTGAVLRDKDGNVTVVQAKATIIATGSFQANKGMIEHSLGRWGDCANIRATPYNKGAGINAALACGARLSKGLGRFYGHLNPWPQLTPHTEEEFEAADLDAVSAIMGIVQRMSTEGIAVNMNGRRFTDEGPEAYVGDNYLANDAMQQADGHIYVIIDSAQDHANDIDSLRNCGAVLFESQTIDELADMLETNCHVNAAHVKSTVEEYRASAAAGTTNELEVPKTPQPTGYLTMLDTPPYYAIQAAAGISGFYGGLVIGEDCAVKGDGDRDIPGLYAAPMAAGGIFYKEYGGGLALLATFGTIAGESAAAYATA